MRNPGWQQPAIPRKPPSCPHLGLLIAALSINAHAEGHVWVCTCGKGFMVVSDGGRNKHFVDDPWRNMSMGAALAPAETREKPQR